MPASPRIQPFWRRRPRRLWTGLALALPTGALLSALLVALLAGWWVLGNPLAHANMASLVAACGGTLLAAAAAAPVLALGLWWGHAHGRLGPGKALAWFALPWVLGSAALFGGLFGALAGYAGYLSGAFALQALVSWALFCFMAYPPYALVSSRPAPPKS